VEAATHGGHESEHAVPRSRLLAFALVSGGIVAASADAIAANFGQVSRSRRSRCMCLASVWATVVSKVLRYPESVARTVSIEVGMQNGGMAASLAREHFAAMPLAAAAGVFSGAMQNVIGGLLACVVETSHAGRLPHEPPRHLLLEV